MKGGNVSRNIYTARFIMFKLVTTPKKETALLAIPETCAKKIITLYYSSLVAGHQGVIKTYFTIGDRFFIPGLIHYLQLYIKGCHICQLSRNDKPPVRLSQARINFKYTPNKANYSPYELGFGRKQNYS